MLTIFGESGAVVYDSYSCSMVCSPVPELPISISSPMPYCSASDINCGANDEAEGAFGCSSSIIVFLRYSSILTIQISTSDSRLCEQLTLSKIFSFASSIYSSSQCFLIHDMRIEGLSTGEKIIIYHMVMNRTTYALQLYKLWFYPSWYNKL